MSNRTYILTLSCADVRGIVAAVSGFLAEQDGFIIESAQFGDFSTGRFFMRTKFSTGAGTPPDAELRGLFARRIGQPFEMTWELHDADEKARVVVMVSKWGHCLNDLMHRYLTGNLAMEIVGVISNHDDLREVVGWHKIPYHTLPVTPDNKAAQEAEMLRIIDGLQADTVVLARYMQVLSDDFCARLPGRIINIHHSFLPSFKGAKPYHQAFDRGVKLIGATAHYVTADLDEGPIIDQDVARVDHTATPEDLAALGRDVESQVLARALKYHIQHRVLLNGHKTVVFR